MVVLYTDLIRSRDEDPRFLLKILSLSLHWCEDRGLIKQTFGQSRAEMASWMKTYIEFLRWFDGAVSIIRPAVELLGQRIPALAPYSEMVAAAADIYNFVRAEFPVDDTGVSGRATKTKSVTIGGKTYEYQ